MLKDVGQYLGLQHLILLVRLDTAATYVESRVIDVVLQHAHLITVQSYVAHRRVVVQ